VEEGIGGEVLSRLAPVERRRLEADAGSLLTGRAQTWQRVGGDAAPTDPCERALCAAGHFFEAERQDEATAGLLENENLLLQRGAGGEVRALLGRMAGLRRDPSLTALTLRVLVATGQIRLAAELWDSIGTPTPALRLTGAELALLAGDPGGALARLEPVLRDADAAT